MKNKLLILVVVICGSMASYWGSIGEDIYSVGWLISFSIFGALLIGLESKWVRR